MEQLIALLPAAIAICNVIITVVYRLLGRILSKEGRVNVGGVCIVFKNS